MKSIRSLVIGAMAILAIAGLVSCSTIDMSTKTEGQKLADNSDKGIAHINARVTGIYLFYFIPLISGDPENVGSSSFFKDTVKPDSSVGMLTRKASDLGVVRVSDLTLRESESGGFSLWIIWAKNTEASANAVK